jgi:hypothetical protein
MPTYFDRVRNKIPSHTREDVKRCPRNFLSSGISREYRRNHTINATGCCYVREDRRHYRRSDEKVQRGLLLCSTSPPEEYVITVTEVPHVQLLLPL